MKRAIELDGETKDQNNRLPRDNKMIESKKIHSRENNITCRYCKSVNQERLTGFDATNREVAFFVDPQGAEHTHDPNVIFFTSKCRCGNVSFESSISKCWCGWKGKLGRQ